MRYARQNSRRIKTLQKKLLATGGEELVEGNDWNDRIWGKVNGQGENRLGIIFMKVREELRL
ncbi:NADAR domain-containing protein [Ruminococcus albus]|uniref:NADAR domain-containing protein n=1 Tax=Ruminococcus albus TaxID=1264 RepID=UPI001FA74A6F|nr:NADAR domain-containing protein [Ruminococcus albus]